MRILNNLSFTGNICKMVELSDEFVLNGQIYDKSTLVPKPLEFLPISSSSMNEIILNEYGIVDDIQNDQAMLKSNMSVITDTRDPNITYVIRPGIDSFLNIFKVDRKNKTLSFNAAAANMQSQCVSDFVDQDENYLYVLTNVSNAATSTSNRICRVDKTTMVVQNVSSFGQLKTVSYIASTPVDIYLLVSDQNKSTLLVYKYSKTTGTASIVFQESGDTIDLTEKVIPSKINNSNTFYVTISGFNANGLRTTLIKSYELNISESKVYAKIVDLDMSASPTGLTIPYDSSEKTFNSLFEHSKDGKSYVTLIKTSISKDMNILYLFEKQENGFLKLIQEEKFSPLKFSHIHQINNGEGLLFYNSYIAIFYVWNSNKNKYEKANSYFNNFKIVGFDKNNRIFILNSDKTIEAFSKATPLKIEAKLEIPFYEYVGRDIDTNIILFAENFYGKYISTTVNVYLNGPAVFVENNKKKITITTSNLSTNIIPVKITGSGYITVNTEIL